MSEWNVTPVVSSDQLFSVLCLACCAVCCRERWRGVAAAWWCGVVAVGCRRHSPCVCGKERDSQRSCGHPRVTWKSRCQALGQTLGQASSGTRYSVFGRRESEVGSRGAPKMLISGLHSGRWICRWLPQFRCERARCGWSEDTADLPAHPRDSVTDWMRIGEETEAGRTGR